MRADRASQDSAHGAQVGPVARLVSKEAAGRGARERGAPFRAAALGATPVAAVAAAAVVVVVIVVGVGGVVARFV